MAKRLGFLIASLALALVAAEGGLRLASRHLLHNLDVEMWRYARLVKRADPELVEDHRPAADETLMGVRVRTDEHGFRLAGHLGTHPRDAAATIAALGDSLTFGWGVPAVATWPAQLEQLLRQRCGAGGEARVVNAGIGNSNTAMQLARYRRYVRPLRPRWVVLGYFVNDAEPVVRVAENPLLRSSALAALFTARWRQARQSALRNYDSYYNALYRPDAPGWAVTRRALSELGDQLRRDGVAATLLLLPEMHQPHGFGAFAPAYRAVRQVASEAGFEVVDPSASFPRGSGRAYWVSATDAHPNAQGQALFARALLGSRFACRSGDSPQLPLRPRAMASTASANALAAHR